MANPKGHIYLSVPLTFWCRWIEADFIFQPLVNNLSSLSNNVLFHALKHILGAMMK